MSSSHKQAVRTARSNEKDSVSSKIVANHNHSHVMTVQYWEVMRRYKIESCINDVNLVLFVPFSLIDFGQMLNLNSIADNSKCKALRENWRNIVRYYDILYPALPYQYRKGLNLCRKYYNLESFKVREASSEGMIFSIKVNGTFTSFDDITASSVKMIMKDGRCFHPISVTSNVYSMPLSEQNTSQLTRKSLISHLKERFMNIPRALGESYYFEFYFIINDDYTVNDIVRIDIDRSCFGYEATAFQFLKDESWAGLLIETFKMVEDNKNTDKEAVNAAHYSQMLDSLTMEISPREIMQLSNLTIFSVTQTGWDSDVTFAVGACSDSHITINAICNQSYLPPDELREINITLEHIRDNRVDYSRLVWGSLSTTELALILDNYTIESDDYTAADGRGNAGKGIPLLNCIDVMSPIGFYGNSLMFPFSMPKELAERIGKTSKEIQNNLYKYHANAFRVPSTSISLPTKGMVGEATLGETNVSEKIDLTRFWNWKDSDIDHLDISSEYMNKNSILNSDNATTIDIQAATQGAPQTAHINAPDLASALLNRKDPTFKDLSSLVNMNDLLKNSRY